MLAGVLILLVIVIAIGWVIWSWPQPGWRGPGPAVPTSPGR
jgi:hypothetical protein